MLLGACRLKKRILVLMVGLWSILSLPSCGGYKKPGPPSGLNTRVLASQGVSSTSSSGRLVIIDGYNDTLARVSAIGGRKLSRPDGDLAYPKHRGGLRRER